MAQKFLSPGVFATEFDQSALAQGVAGIGAVVIGRSPKGPAYVPTLVSGFDDYVDRFGDVDPELQLPYAARNYLRNAGALTVVRVLGHKDGTSASSGYTIPSISGIADSGSNGKVLAVLHHSGALAIAGVPGDGDHFTISIGSLFAATGSFLTSSADYVGKVLNTDPTKFSTYGHYLYRLLSYARPQASASWKAVGVTGSLSGNFLRDFEGGVTTNVKSQPIGGLEFDLFSFETIPHGRATNDQFKVEITNVKSSPSPAATPFGSFDVLVRRFDDTDARPIILESFVGVSLDPSQPSYIARRIGDMEEVFDTVQRKFVASGEFPNKSKLIRVVMVTDQNSPDEALPWGFRGYPRLDFAPGPSGSNLVPELLYVAHQRDRQGNIDQNIAWGVQFLSGGVADRMRAFPDSASALLTDDTDFSLEHLSSSLSSGKLVYSYATGTTGYQPVYASASLYKFSMPFYGGFDGWDLRVEDPLALSNVADETDIGVVSLKRSVETVANPDAFDMNLIAIPGVHNLKVADAARSMVNERRDVLYIMDITGSTVGEAVGQLRNRDLDDNYTACYYPDLKLNDRKNSKVVRVAPSVAVLGTLAFSDRVGQPWFAPAGLNRGGLAQFDIVDVVDRLNFQDRNDLYDNRINPIATFPSEGIVVFGQKTLQVKASALDRINVRRLLIFAKKTISSAAKFLLFEGDNASTWQRFVNMVNPILEKVRQDQGIERFKVVMDSSTNTSDLIDRNIIAGKIFLQPTKSAEFIDLSFIITNAGVAFGE